MQRLVKALSSPTAKASAFFYFGSFALSLGRYFFHLILLRLLTPGEYGEFLAYLSLLYLLSIPNSTISNVVVKFVSEFRGKDDQASINRFFYYLLRQLAPGILVLGSLLIIGQGTLAAIFKAHPGAFVILGLSVFLSLPGSLIRSYITAFHRFSAAIIVGFVEVIVSIVLAFFFIRARLSATGAVLALILASLLSLVIFLVILRRYLFPPHSYKKNQFNLGRFTGYSFIYAAGSLSLISSDILVVRSVMSEHLSGIYSSLSIIGRSLYFALGPIIALVLPIASHRQAATQSARSVFHKLGLVILFFGLSATAIFALFPKFIISFVSTNYLEAASYLPLFAASMFLFSLNLFIITYLMAVGYPQVNLLFGLATLAQPILIYVFHSSLNQVVSVNFVLEASLFCLLLWQLKRRDI